MSTELVPYSDIEKMAGQVVQSRMFPGITTPQAAMTLMLLCQSEGLHPMQAMMRYHVIQGRPAMKADAMLAEFMRRGGTVKWKEWTNEACEAEFKSAGCPEGVSVRWTMDDAKRAGVTGNPTWTKYPRQMLKARVASDGVRMADPAVNQGRHTPEEVQDYVDEAPKTVPADAEIVETPVLESTSLDAEEKPLKEVLGKSKATVAAALDALETPRECQCGARIMKYASESKAYPGRLFWLCSAARLDMSFMEDKKAAQMKFKEHYGVAKREWAGPPIKDSGAAPPETPHVEGIPNAPELSIQEQLAKIERETAERIAAEVRLP